MGYIVKLVILLVKKYHASALRVNPNTLGRSVQQCLRSKAVREGDCYALRMHPVFSTSELRS